MLLKEIFDIKVGALLNRYKSLEKTDIRCRAFNLKSIENISISGNTLDKIYLKQELSRDFFSKGGDILLKVSAPYNSALITKEYENILIPTNFFILRLKEEHKDKILPSYVLYVLNSNKIKNQIKRTQQGNTAVISLKKTDLSEMVIDIPPIEKQKQKAGLYDLMGKRLSLLRRKIELEERLFKGIINLN